MTIAMAGIRAKWKVRINNKRGRWHGGSTGIDVSFNLEEGIVDEVIKGLCGDL